jgi:hypothetical protein
MPTKEDLLQRFTHPEIKESGTRVLHVLEGDGEHDKAAVRRLSKALSWLVAKLEHDGALTADDIGELLLHSVL